jgi:hypothetical protein
MSLLQETKMVFEKLYKFIGKDIKSMMERPEGHYCLRLHKNRVYYVSEALMKKATNVSSSRGAGHLLLLSVLLFRRFVVLCKFRSRGPASALNSTHSSSSRAASCSASSSTSNMWRLLCAYFMWLN